MDISDITAMQDVKERLTRIEARLDNVACRQEEMAERFDTFMPLANGTTLKTDLSALELRARDLEIRAAVLETVGKRHADTLTTWVDIIFKLITSVVAAWLIWKLGLK